MRYAYYPGCSLHSSAKEYDVSIRVVFYRLGITLVEPPDWVCCGSSFAHSLSEKLALSLPLQNLNQVEKMGMDEVIVPCSACFSRFKNAQAEVRHDPKKLALVEKILNEKVAKDVKVVHPLELFTREAIGEKIPELIKKDFSSLKVASYYGCLLTRPPEVMRFDECEYPQIMDNVLQTCGFETIDWSYKTDCCGAAFALTRSEDTRLNSSHIPLSRMPSSA